MTAPKWDEHIDMVELWNQYNRIIKKNGTIALFASQPFTTKIISSNEKDFRYCWYWLKNQGTNFFHAKRMPIRKIEEICIFKKGKYYPQITDGHAPTNSAKGCSNGKTYHGTNTRNYDGGQTTRFPTNILEFKCVDNELFKEEGYPLCEIDPSAIEKINKIIRQTKAKVVISSSWLLGRSIQNLQDIFNKKGFIGTIDDITPHLRYIGNDNTVPRGCEIETYLNDNFERFLL